MFDVSVDNMTNDYDYRVIPNATLSFGSHPRYLMEEKLATTVFVPVVYITLEAIRESRGKEGILASRIVERVKNMVSYNEIPNVEGLQLDCDWTPSTRKSFFALCDSVKAQFGRYNLPWNLSSTIRLHQLSSSPPPVDYGVLMVYNTGKFNDPDEPNSIISEKNVAPYLRHLASYPLHLDIAYPTYSWQLLFRDRTFVGLMNGVDLSDEECFTKKDNSVYIAKKTVPYNNTLIYKGDMIRQENSSIDDIRSIQDKIEQILGSEPHSNILYHFDLNNFSTYTNGQIYSILNRRD